MTNPESNPPKFMHESGLLFEINRKILHPLGLALFYVENDDGSIASHSLGLMATPDGEPFDFAPDRIVAAEARLAAFLAQRNTAK